MIRVYALILAAALVLSFPTAAFAQEGTPPELPVAPNSDTGFSVEESMPIGVSDVTDSGSPPPESDISSQDVPEAERPPLAMYIDGSEQFTTLRVTLPPECDDATGIFPYYSFDGETFLPVDDGYGCPNWAAEPSYLEPYAEPLASYKAGDVDEFWLYVEIEGSSYTGRSQVCNLVREAEAQQEIKVATLPAATIRTANTYRMHLRCNVTVREGCTDDALAALLPAALPIEIVLTDEKEQQLARQLMDYPLILLPGRTARIIPPSGEVVIRAPGADYPIEQLPPVTLPTDVNDEFIEPPLDLIINTIPANEKAAPQLGISYNNTLGGEALSFSLPHKPSGAKSIVAEYSQDGGASWLTVERAGGNDLVTLGYPPDMVPKQADYGAPLFFDSDKTPMKEYLEDNSRGFLVRLKIDGGVYDGISEAVPWPGDYKFDPPLTINPAPGDGGDGNRGDVGSDDDGDSAGSGGQRPDLPEGEKPPETVAPPATIPQVPTAITPTLPVRPLEPTLAPDDTLPGTPRASAPSHLPKTEHGTAREDLSSPTPADSETQPALAQADANPPQQAYEFPVAPVAAVVLVVGGAAAVGFSSTGVVSRLSGLLKAIKTFFRK